ncbi:MAG: hypothetical protein ACHQPI_11740 [Thermoanaerobaculia bacterium]
MKRSRGGIEEGIGPTLGVDGKKVRTSEMRPRFPETSVVEGDESGRHQDLARLAGIVAGGWSSPDRLLEKTACAPEISFSRRDLGAEAQSPEPKERRPAGR